MSIVESITTRRNIKQFKPDPISKDDILSWLQAATMAPNHRMTEPWQVLFIGPETRAKLNHKTDFGGAPVVLVIVAEPGKTPVDSEENIVAASCFLQNFMLAAHEHGVGTGITSLGATPTGRAILEVPDGYAVVATVPVGYPADVPSPKARTPIMDKLKQLP